MFVVSLPSLLPIHFIVVDIRKLTNRMIKNLSKCLSEEDELITLAELGLEMHPKYVHRHLVNNQGDVYNAALSLLKDWRETQTDSVVAYKTLCDALERVKMEFYISQALKY